MKNVILLFSLVIIFLGFNCKGTTEEVIPEAPANLATPTFTSIAITTDKAVYKPSDEVIFTLDNSVLPASAKVRYKFQNTVLAEVAVTTSTWKWQTPADDYRGYLVEVYATSNNTETIYATIGIDVSSDWKKFPRYGFISRFDQMADADINSVISNLNRFHINGLQFYDWQNKHHKPLAMNGTAPASSWQDIGGRTNYFSTIQKYIAAAHGVNMKAMFYDLVYGAWENADADGVSKEWYIYKDNTHTNRDFFALNSPFLSNLYLLDPSNVGWQNYMINEAKNVYQNLSFDGYHMDQVGNWGTRYSYDGISVNFSNAFKSYIDAFKQAIPAKYNVMNAVAQNGQQGIGSSTSDFMYSEVWSPSDSYNDLSLIIKQNNTLSNNTKNTVLAAYMNYDMAATTGYFNTSSVLMTNAVIFAFGGSHLELGEHMLCREYFPNNNLSMKDDLKRNLVYYYDFLVAYQNLLRNGGIFNTVAVSSIDKKMTLDIWPASQAKVAIVAKKVDNKQIIHFINFTNSTTQKWRDNTAIQVMPALIKDAKLAFATDSKVKKMWIATPDFVGCASRSLNFAQIGNKVSFTLPELRYWDMVVVEY
jgi:dextranase